VGQIKPPKWAKPTCQKHQNGEADFILLIRVHYRPDKVVYDSQGHAWVRIGDQKHELTKEECRELEIDKGQIDCEQEPVADMHYPEAFDIDRVSLFARTFRKSRGLSYEQTDEQLLALRHLGKIENGSFIPNVACVLLFAKDPSAKFPGCRIRFRRFEGIEEQTGTDYNAVKDYWAEGNIPSIIERTAQILDSQIREFSKLGPDGHFYAAPEYPHDAWFEALVNACVHRSYGMRNMHTTVEMFYDRMLIESPGAFPPFVTPENIYDTQTRPQPQTHGRDVLSRFREVRQRGNQTNARYDAGEQPSHSSVPTEGSRRGIFRQGNAPEQLQA
jgi:ATP-dependent DNA helicase RecG